MSPVAYPCVIGPFISPPSCSQAGITFGEIWYDAVKIADGPSINLNYARCWSNKHKTLNCRVITWYYQADLQTAVVIANEFKMEAQENIEKYVSENALLKERNIALAEEISKLHEEIAK